MITKKYCLFCDLKDDPFLIEEYKEHHKNVWPEILESIKESGIEKMNIYNLGNRLFMIIEVNELFSFDKKAALDANNLKVQVWESLMWKYQQVLPMAKKGEKWLLLEEIFKV
jgi:L-rhamnose mutarotase